MSTRSAIARIDDIQEGTFTGVYHHWDGYPDGLGAELFELANSDTFDSLSDMLDVLIDTHPAGWSNILNKDWSKDPGYIEQYWEEDCSVCGEDYDSHFEDEEEWKNNEACDRFRTRPNCYCHGDRSEEASEVNQENASSFGCEWVYAFDEENRIMYVLNSFHKDGTKMIGMFGCGDPDADWIAFAAIPLDGEEPVWDKIQCGENLEWCGHVAWYHFPETKGTPSGRLGAQKYLGQRELTPRDAYAVMLDGDLVEFGGSGMDKDGVWHKNLEDGRWIPVWKNERPYEPFPGIELVYPKLKDEFDKEN